MKYRFIAVLNEFETHDGYTVSFPDIPGAICEANNWNEAVKNAKEVLESFLLMYEEEGTSIPEPSAVIDLAHELNSKGDLLQAIEVDTELARVRENSRAVNKMVTLPKWLLDEGKKHKVNFSQLLQEALKEELQLN